MSKHWIPWACVLAATLPLLAAPPAETQQAVPAPAPAPDQKPMTVTVVSVSGPAQRLNLAAGEKDWQPLKAGEKLNELTVIRTGLGAKVVLKFEDRGEVTVNNATKVGIGEFRKDGDLAKTKLGLKYGTLHARVDRTAGPSDFRVVTAVAVASVRGSHGTLGFSGDMGMGIQGGSGTWNVATGAGSQNIQPGQTTNGNLTDPIELALDNLDPKMGDVHGGLDPTEEGNLRNNGGGRGIFGFTGSGSGSFIQPIGREPSRKRRKPDVEF